MNNEEDIKIAIIGMGMSGLDNISVIKNHLARRAMGLD